MPHFLLEQNHQGCVAGIDEVGRGPWAGPVVAAAVVFKVNQPIPGLDDSKKLTEKKREALFERIKEQGQIGIGQASVEEIDRYNILQASLIAMQRAVENLPFSPDYALVDGNKMPQLACAGEAVVKGDSISYSIAAASVIAKVTRDRLMQELAIEYPHYGWEKNAGYGTKLHQQGLAEYGITEHHRTSFKPIASLRSRNRVV